MAKTAIKALEKKKDALRQDIVDLALSTRERINVLGGRLRELHAEMPGQFEEYLDTLPISRRTAYNWINANKRIESGEQPENISDLYTLESGQCAKVAHANSVVTSTYGDSESENDEEEYEKDGPVEDEEEWEYETEPEEIKTAEATVIDTARVKKDRFGQEIPEHLHAVFTAIKTYEKWTGQLALVKKDIKAVIGEIGFTDIEDKYVDSRFANLYEVLRSAQAYCICPVCAGEGGLGSKCGHCRGTGYMTKRIFHTLPEEYKVGLDNYNGKGDE